MHPAWGSSPDTALHFPEAGLNVHLRATVMGHPEPIVNRGWALPVSLEEVRELAARFFQMGIFWFDGDHFFIEPVLAAVPAVELPVRAPLYDFRRPHAP